MTARGAGRRILFESDEDRAFYIGKLASAASSESVSILAWCLMDNHVHLLCEGGLPPLARMMHQLNTSYAHRFNGAHGHVGPVFQSRFDSAPVESDAHFVEVVRYIHLNAKDLGLSEPLAYEWSSYREYASGGEGGLCDRERVLDAFGGFEGMAAFHDVGGDDLALVAMTPHRPRVSDAEARSTASSLFGTSFADGIAQMDRSSRDRALKRLYDSGLSIRQIERLTGIGSTAIHRAKERAGRQR